MNRTEIEEFVAHWCASWNASDLEAIVGHFREDATFTSPKAAQITGNATLKGKEALRAYWGAAIERARSRVFTPRRNVWDPETRELALLYVSDVDGLRRHAVEFFQFDDEGLVISGEAMYGAEV